MHQEPLLPSGFEPLQILREVPGGIVLHARHLDQEVVLRIHQGGPDRQSLAELNLLGSIRHPGLAGLVDHGTHEGWHWVAREWIQGRTLSEVAGESSPARIGKLIASITPALEHLHRSGFVHGDIKPENVLIRENDEPVLTDFGLSTTSTQKQAPGVAGSHFSIAPEILLGQPAGPHSDLFAVGVMLHQLLVGKRTTAREFYARFPHVPFFEATETTQEDLPEWARAQTCKLLELDPHKRQSSALAVGRALSAALGFELAGALETEPRIICPRTLGREAWVEGWIESVRSEFQRFQQDSGTSRQPVSPVRLLLPEGENRNAFLSHLALRAAIDRVPVRTLDLSTELAEIKTTAQLDHWARETISSSQDACLFVQGSTEGQWSERALETLARTCVQNQSDPHQDAACLLICASTEEQAEGHTQPWSEHVVRCAGAAEIQQFLQAELNFEQASELTQLAKRLAAEARGASDLLQECIDTYVERGWILTSSPLPRAREGIASARIALASQSTQAPDLNPEAASLARALFVQRDAPTLAAARSLAGLSNRQMATAISELSALDFITLDPSRGTIQTTLRALATPPSAAPEKWRALHQLVLEQNGHSISQSHALRYLAGRDTFEQVLEEARACRKRGCPELTIDLVNLIEDRAPLVGLTLEPELLGELAAAWLLRGDFVRTRQTIDRLKGSDSQRDQAVTAYVQGLLARRKREFDLAWDEFEKARQLGYHDFGELLLSRARLLFERHDDNALANLLAEVDELAPSLIHPRVATDLHNIRAMHSFRMGLPEEALQLLDEQRVLAQEHDDPAHEAGVRINLGTILRHTGHWEQATEHFKAAEKYYDQAGFLPGLAQARALLGACLRDLGQLADAEPLLTSSLEIRERLGDLNGRDAALGMLGLLHADQGVPRDALDELGRACDALTKSGRTQDALILATRLDEVRARVAPRARRRMKLTVSDKDDPRCFIARSKAAWLRGDSAAATEYATHARERAVEASSRRAEEEALFLLEHLAPDDSARQGHGPGYTNPVVSLDDDVLRLLEGDNFDTDKARLLAGTLASRGRKDRAVRLYWAIRARSSDERLARECSKEGHKLFAEIARGLTDMERQAFSNCLLGIPDPWPEDLAERETSVTRSGYQEHELELLLEVSRSLVRQADLPELLGSIVECALSLTGGKRGFIVLEENGELHFDTAIDSRRGDIAAPEVETSASVIHQSLEAMRPLRLSNASDDPLLGSSPSVMDLELRSIISCPFVVREGVRGVIYVDHKLQAGAFDERTERLISHLAHQAALAIRQVHYVKEIKQLNARLQDRVAATESHLRTARAALREAGVPVPTTGIVGSSDSIRRVHELIGRAAPTALPVLIIGASGTGKELAARALHDLGARADGPFISENCASLPASLIEAEFFGYKRGAFTGADSDRKGMFERAAGGTIFLDEIGELSLELQAKLLRVLETGEVRRLGDSELRQVDFRLLAATNRDLELGVKEKRFRADLYYRLDALRVDMPPLSARVGDIPELVQHFMSREAARSGIERDISKRVIAALCRRAWPGNVRELSNEVARLCVLTDGDLVDPDAVRSPADFETGDSLNAITTLEETERHAIERAIRRCNGDKDKAAALLNISRAKIYQRLKLWRETDLAGS